MASPAMWEGPACFTGWWLTYPSEKYESQISQIGSSSQLLGKIKGYNFYNWANPWNGGYIFGET